MRKKQAAEEASAAAAANIPLPALRRKRSEGVGRLADLEMKLARREAFLERQRAEEAKGKTWFSNTHRTPRLSMHSDGEEEMTEAEMLELCREMGAAEPKQMGGWFKSQGPQTMGAHTDSAP